MPASRPKRSRLTIADRLWLHVAMKRVKIAALEDRLSYHLRAVEAGAEVEVTDRERPIARIVPIEGESTTLVTRPVRPFTSIRARTYPLAHGVHRAP